MSTTPAWERLRATVLSIRAGFVVLDNVAHPFAGNKNIRNQVAAFCGLLNGLAAEADAAILLIGDPNESGDSYPGSTAWENQVRARLFLERPRDDDGSIPDPNARVLSREKANYAPHGEAVEFRWYRGPFVQPRDLAAEVEAELAATAMARADDKTFLASLDKLSAECRVSSPSTAASNCVPRLFAIMPTAQKTPARRLEAARHRLLDAGEIKGEGGLFQRENRAWVTGLGRAPTPAPTMHEPAPTDATTP